MKVQMDGDRMGGDERRGCDLMTYEETAALLGVPKGTLYSWVFERRVPHVRLGPRLVRFSRKALAEWVAERTVVPER